MDVCLLAVSNSNKFHKKKNILNSMRYKCIQEGKAFFKTNIYGNNPNETTINQRPNDIDERP